jgi:hypothetical protein
MSRKLKHLFVSAWRRRGERQASDEWILGDGEFKGGKTYGIPANSSPLMREDEGFAVSSAERWGSKEHPKPAPEAPRQGG